MIDGVADAVAASAAAGPFSSAVPMRAASGRPTNAAMAAMRTIAGRRPATRLLTWRYSPKIAR